MARSRRLTTLAPPLPPPHNNTNHSSRLYIRSRRAWRHENPRIPPAAPAKTLPTPNEPKTPWPKSVVYPAAVITSLVVPYLTGWVLASLPFLRDNLPSSYVDVLRQWYGTLDPYALSYVDQRQRQRDEPTNVPKTLPGEASEPERCYRNALEQTLSDDSIVNVQLVPLDDHDQIVTTLVKTITLPASQLARTSELWNYLDGPPTETSQVAALALDFVEPEENVVHTDNSTTSDFNTTVPVSLSDPLLAAIAIYSTWHYQSHQPVTGHVTNSLTNEELQIQQLEADLQRFEYELQQSSTTG